MRQMDEYPWRLLEECLIISSFLVCHTLSSFHFLVSSFVSSQFEKISRCPTGDIALPRIKCSYPGLTGMVNLFWRPVPDVLSTWHLAEVIPGDWAGHISAVYDYSQSYNLKNTTRHHIRRLRNYLNPDFYTHLVQQFSELGWVFIAPSAGNQGQDKESAALLSRWVSRRLSWLHHTAHQRSSALYFH